MHLANPANLPTASEVSVLRERISLLSGFQNAHSVLRFDFTRPKVALLVVCHSVCMRSRSAFSRAKYKHRYYQVNHLGYASRGASWPIMQSQQCKVCKQRCNSETSKVDWS